AKHPFSAEGLPRPLLRLLDGEGLADKVGVTFLLTTIESSGWPRMALLGAGEVLAVSPQELRLALWPDSRTAAALTASGRGTLFLVHGGAAYTVRLAARRLANLPAGDAALACFGGAVVEGEEDRVGYATLTGGISFRLHHPEQVLARWKVVIEALRAIPADD
ncbi:MAG: hypothetical protein V3S29_11985, partial [bacterium]